MRQGLGRAGAGVSVPTLTLPRASHPSRDRGQIHTLSAQVWGGSRSETVTRLWYKELDTSLLWEELSSGNPVGVL